MLPVAASSAAIVTTWVIPPPRPQRSRSLTSVGRLILFFTPMKRAVDIAAITRAMSCVYTYTQAQAHTVAHRVSHAPLLFLLLPLKILSFSVSLSLSATLVLSHPASSASLFPSLALSLSLMALGAFPFPPQSSIHIPCTCISRERP